MCEDFPCCNHENGCCPDFEDGVQLNMKCTCGTTVPLGSRSSICRQCLQSAMRQDDGYEDPQEDSFDYYD